MIGQIERVFELSNLKRDKANEGTSKIFAVTSGKGGTGKTFLSVNLAYALSKLNKKVLLVDLDPNLSNVNIMLNTAAPNTLMNFYLGKNQLTDLILKYEENFHLILGDSGRIDYPQSNEENINFLFSRLHELEGNYDFIILDTGSGAGREIISILKKSRFNLIVTTPEPTAVMDAYVMLKLLKHNHSASDNYIIVNRAAGQKEGEEAFGNLTAASEHFLKMTPKLIGIIEYERSVSRSIISQELYLKREPNSKISSQMNALAERIEEIIHLANINQPNSAGL